MEFSLIYLGGSFMGFDYQSSEEEANIMAKQFKNSNDVISDMSSYLGADFSNVNIHNDNSIGRNAYAKGNNIYFGEGMNRPEVMAHELTHTIQQGISTQTGGKIIQSAPSGIVQGWALGEHTQITRTANQKARQKLQEEGINVANADNKSKALEVGARFNDVDDDAVIESLDLSKPGTLLEDPKNIIKFTYQYLNHSNEFVNQSHHGDMQFLHSQRRDGDDILKAAQKSKSWVKFCIEVRLNPDIHNKNIVDYIIEKNDLQLNEMLLSVMLKKEVLEDIDTRVNSLQKNDEEKNNIRNVLIKGLLSEQGNRSKFGKRTVAEFFADGSGLDKENKSENAKMIATGSLSHTIEDSFADSHGQRAQNFKEQDDVDITNKNAVLASQTKILNQSNYSTQDEKKHGKADFSGKKNGQNQGIMGSQGSAQAVNSVSYVLYMLEKIESLDDEEEKARLKGELDDFINKTFEVDANVDAIERIKRGEDVQLPEGSALQGLKFQKMKDKGKAFSITTATRQYENDDWIKKEGKFSKARKNLKRYFECLNKQEVGNTKYTIDEKIDHYKEQSKYLLKAMLSAKNTETHEHIREHAVEMLVNLDAIKNDVPQDKVAIYNEIINNLRATANLNI